MPHASSSLDVPTLRAGADYAFGWTRLLLTATFFALAAGAGEAAIAGFNILVRHYLTWVSHDVAWMSPLAYLILFLPTAVVLRIGLRIARRPVSPGASAGVFAFLGTFSLLLPYEQLSRWAALALSIGVAVQLAGIARRNAERWHAWMRTGTIALGVLVSVTGLGVRLWRATAEHLALGGLPAAASGAPNVLFIVLDTERASNLSLYGYGRATTPELARRAREGVLFERALSSAPWTLPSHASMMTGRTAGSLGAGWRTPLSRAPETLADAMSARGYRTAAFVANFLYTSYESGLARGFAHFDDYPFSLRLILLHASLVRTSFATHLYEDHSRQGIGSAVRAFNLGVGNVPADVVRPANSVTDAFLQWQAGNEGRPFFAFLNYFDAHGPYRSPQPWASRFGGAHPKKLDHYDNSIAWLDHELGRLLDSLEHRTVLDRTIVVITSDHGEQFGEHRLSGHANSLYLPLLHVPLVIRYPARVPAGRRVGAIVPTRDIAATVLDLAGGRGGVALPGRSLAQYWNDSLAPVVPSPVLAEVAMGINVDSLFPNSRGPMRAIVDDRLHYILNGWGREELYAYREDSLEARNLIATPAMRADVQRLKHSLDSARAPVGAGHP